MPRVRSRSADRGPGDTPPPARARAPAEAALALQRGAGNRALGAVLARRSVRVELRSPPPLPPPEPAVERATPENRALAEEIDALEKLGDAELVKRRVDVTLKLQSLSVTATEKEEQRQLHQTLSALEYVANDRHRRARYAGDSARERELAPVEPDRTRWRYVRRDPARRRAWTRWLVEQRVREEGSLTDALKVIRSTTTYGADLSEIEDDLAGIERERDAFAREFHGQALVNARRVLQGSLAVIDGLLEDYGLSPTVAHGAAEELYKGDEGVPGHRGNALELDAAADLVVSTSKQQPEARAADPAKRADLRASAKRLKELQQKVLGAQKHMWKRAGEGGTEEQARADKAAFVEAKNELAAAWFDAERNHAVLANYRRGLERDKRAMEDSPFAKIDLGALDSAQGDADLKAVAAHVLWPLAHIGRAWHRIEHGLSPLRLPAVVALTEANMFIPPGSIRAAVVSDLVEAEKREPWLVLAAGLALSLVTLLPTGGASLVMINVASGALAAYTALGELERYETQKTLIDTDLDKARALSQEEPSLSGFAWSLVGLGLEPLFAYHALSKAAELRGLLRRGQPFKIVRDELNEIGRSAGVPNLGDRALEEALEAERAAKAAAKPPHVEPHAPKPHAEPPKAPTPPHGEPPKTPPKPHAEPPTPPKAKLEPPPPKKKPTSAKETAKERHEKLGDKPKGKGGGKGKGGEPEGPKGAPRLPPRAPGGTTPAFTPPPVDPWHGQGITDHYPRIMHATVEDLRRELGQALRATAHGPSPQGALIDEIRGVIAGGGLAHTPANDFVVAHLEDVYKIVRDPDVITDAGVALWEQAGTRKTLTRLHLEDLAGGNLQDVRGRLTRAHLQRDEAFRDLFFAADIHGAHTHTFQLEFLLDRTVQPGFGRAVRQAVANAEGPDILFEGRRHPFWSALWDALVDVGEGNEINRPEVLGKILQQHVGLPRWTPPPP